MRHKQPILILLVLLVLSGCRNQSNIGFSIPEGITDVNKSVLLTAVDETFDVRIGTIVLVENVSRYDLIYFSADTDVQLYFLQGGKWLPVTNNVNYYPSADNLLKPSEEGNPFWRTISVNPLMNDVDKKVKIRVLVIATVMENDLPTDEKVAAYIDLWAEP